MSTVDLTGITSLAAQVSALQSQLTVATDPTVKAFLQSQISVAEQQLQALALHQQAQVDASNNMLQSLQLSAVLNSTLSSVATSIPSIIALFK